MKRGTNDFVNRPIRFSFYEIFTDKREAWTAFTWIISDFGGAEKVMQSLIREKPSPGNNGENVEFRQEDFTAWLQGKKHMDINFSACIEGNVIERESDTWPDMWPPEGTKNMMKFSHS